MEHKEKKAQVDLKTAMPLTAQWIAEQRGRFGNVHVADCIRRSMHGERNLFYAIEAGHIVGTPFDWEPKGAYVVSMSVLTGAKFVAALLGKDGVVEMAIQPNGATAHGAH